MIYIIRAGDGDTVKIGFTNNKISLQQRLSSLRTGCPLNLRIESVMSGSKKKERCLHSFCIKRHIRGEWFRLSKDEVRRLVAKYGNWSPAKDSIKKVPCIHHQKKGAKIKYHPATLDSTKPEVDELRGDDNLSHLALTPAFSVGAVCEVRSGF